uniref:Uncharacterized protein n=1 Tax=Haemonchus contortus TaxID=6289 RepID=A0A7I4YC67_HAECO
MNQYLDLQWHLPAPICPNSSVPLFYRHSVSSSRRVATIT